MVEQRSPKPTVEGSNPSAPANIKPPPGGFLFFGLCIKQLNIILQLRPPQAPHYACYGLNAPRLASTTSVASLS